MHLHFSSTPSRSNAAIRELARCFRSSDPRFFISASGFHSTAHLLVRLRLGRRYLACFFGDNYPTPRPNGLYQGLKGGLGDSIHVLSLLSYVEALRAGAMGQPFAVTRSLLGTDMGRAMQREGYLFELDSPAADPSGPARIGLLKAIRPDVAFVHAALGDAEGNVVVSAPTGEGFWAANGARRGVIVTVERIVTATEGRQLSDFKDAMPIARHKVLAVCEAPGGAHPQPLFLGPRFGVEGYEDDFEHYRLWRELATDDAQFSRFDNMVLDAPDGEEGYAAFRRAVAEGGFRQKSTVSLGGRPSTPPEVLTADQESLIVSAARSICRKVKAKDYKIIIAGIGVSFHAARLAKTWLARAGVDVDVIVETGLIGIECGPEGHDYLLSHRNTALSERLSNVEDALGVLCGAGNRSLGVIGAAQVDASGAINSTLSPSGHFLVGSGGANDIASSCAEVIVTSPCDRQRLVDKAAYVTSPGERVMTVVTNLCTFSRKDARSPWSLSSVFPTAAGRPAWEALSTIQALCPWPYSNDTIDYERPVSAEERCDLEAIHPLPIPSRARAV